MITVTSRASEATATRDPMELNLGQPAVASVSEMKGRVTFRRNDDTCNINATRKR